MKKIVVIGVLLIFSLICIFMNKGTHSVLEEDTFSIDIYNNNDMDNLRSDMLYFIDLVDNSIIKNSSFNLSSKLNENYDFLTKFAISFILEHESQFDIIYGDNYTYVDEYGDTYVSNKYVDVDLIYEITGKILGCEYYYIVNEDLIIDDKVVLIDFSYEEFNMNIEKISSIYKGNEYYDVYVKYIDNEFDYIYRFDIVDNDRLVISDLRVMG